MRVRVQQNYIAKHPVVKMYAVGTFHLLLMLVHSFLLPSLTKQQDGTTCSICKCFLRKGRYAVDCSFTNISQIPASIPANAFLLNVSHTDIGNINGSPFINMSSLIILGMSNASLVNISAEGFEGLTKLRHLDISCNKHMPLTDDTVPETLFKPLKSLEELKMYGTTNAAIDGTYPHLALAELTSLKTLWIDGLTNRTFGAGFSQLKMLTTVKMAGESTDAPGEFCQTDILDGMLDNLKNLAHLIIYRCNVQHIDGNAFVHLTKLKQLDLSHNTRLGLDKATFPFENNTFKRLQTLILNKVYRRSHVECGVIVNKTTFQRLNKQPRLKQLHLASNKISRIQDGGIPELPKSLRCINVRDNRFEYGNYIIELADLKSLSVIDLSYQFYPYLSKEDDKQIASCMSMKRKGVDVESGVLKDWMVNNLYTNDISNRHRILAEENVDRRISEFIPSVHVSVLDSIYHLPDANRLISDDTPFGNLSDKQCQTLKKPFLLPVPVPPNLTSLDISHSKISHPIFQLTVAPNVITAIDASQSMLYCWDGPVRGLTNLRHLDLSQNFCTRVRYGFFDTFTNLETLLINRNVLGMSIGRDTEGRLLDKLTMLEHFEFAYNRVAKLPRLFFKSSKKLKYLVASCNLISTLNLKLSHMENLTTFNLSGNSIATISEDMRHELESVAKASGKLTLDLSENNLHCQCANLDFLKWVYNHQQDALTVRISTCQLENAKRKTVNNTEQLQDIISTLDTECASTVSLLVVTSISALCLLNAIVIAVVYRFRWKLRYLYYVAGRKMKQRSGYISLDSLAERRNSFMYDAYVAYSEDDRDFILEDMTKYFEQTKGLRLCISERDFIPGQSMFRMIANAVNVSRVAVFVLTRRSLQSREWEIAMRMCQEESLQRGHQIYFAIPLEEIPDHILYDKRWVDLRQLYNTGALLKYPAQGTSEEIELFWQDCLHKITTE